MREYILIRGMKYVLEGDAFEHCDEEWVGALYLADPLSMPTNCPTWEPMSWKVWTGAAP